MSDIKSTFGFTPPTEYNENISVGGRYHTRPKDYDAQGSNRTIGKKTKKSKRRLTKASRSKNRSK